MPPGTISLISVPEFEELPRSPAESMKEIEDHQVTQRASVPINMNPSVIARLSSDGLPSTSRYFPPEDIGEPRMLKDRRVSNKPGRGRWDAVYPHL